MKKVLVIDDSREDRACTVEAFLEAGVARESVLEAADGSEGLARVESDGDIDLVLTDVGMPGMNGLDFLAHMLEAGHAAETWLLTREGTLPYLPQALELGARGAIPFAPRPSELAQSLAALMDPRRT